MNMAHPNGNQNDERLRVKVGLAEIIVTKQRNGPTGVVTLSWSSDTTRFRDLSPISAPGGYGEPRDSYATPVSPADVSGGGHFSAGQATGPVSGFRDGGGPAG